MKTRTKIGSGASGNVYAQGGYAIKRMTRDFLHCSWLREVSVLQVARHPNVIVCIAFDLRQRGEQITHLLKLELGLGDLASIPEVSYETRKQLYGDVLRGLTYCHEVLGVIHRDLKPQNVIVFDQEGCLHAKIADFGMAAFPRDPKGTLRHDMEITTFPWRAPELWEPFLTPFYGTEVDVYSALVLGAEILFGVKPPGFRWWCLDPLGRLKLMVRQGFPVVDMELTDGVEVPSEAVDERWKATKGLQVRDTVRYLNRLGAFKYLTDHFTDAPWARPTARDVSKALGLTTDAPSAPRKVYPRLEKIKRRYSRFDREQASYATARREQIGLAHPLLAKKQVLTDVVGLVLDDEYVPDDEPTAIEVMELMTALDGNVAGIEIE